ncbi:MAG: hypothetical protein ABIH89_09210 [Elusimicrobiota bacterium]
MIDAAIGTVIVIFALGFILLVSIWATRTIDFIHKKRLHSAREIVRKISERK